MVDFVRGVMSRVRERLLALAPRPRDEGSVAQRLTVKVAVPNGRSGCFSPPTRPRS